jgi:UDP-N-acetylmuramoyl-tripeptide--D-alanyl-D-alanine ligase
MKELAKSALVKLLNWQTKRLLKRNKAVLIGVAGSIGKTSTKLAIAKALSTKYKVCYQEGNYNDQLTVPLVVFQVQNPENTFNIFSWMKIVIENEKKIKQSFDFDVVVLELGTDGMGQIESFDYLNLDYGVLTAIAPEHMEFFQDLEEVAQEEKSIMKFSKKVFANKDLAGAYLENGYISYGISNADYSVANLQTAKKSGKFEILHKNKKFVTINKSIISNSEAYSILAAAAIIDDLAFNEQEAQTALELIEPFAGRMQRLKGKKKSLIIDDSYNSSPQALKDALMALKQQKTDYKIAILGSMNELGKFSQEAHVAAGRLCSPAYIDLLITIGEDANKHLASAAEANKCRVVRTSSPYEAGKIALNNIKMKSVILVKGSQNLVFAEEAIKVLLEDKKDVKRLVRQEQSWLKQKSKQFKNA